MFLAISQKLILKSYDLCQTLFPDPSVLLNPNSLVFLDTSNSLVP